MTTTHCPMHSRRERTILLIGGGSGGHLAPGIAIAERLAESGSALRALFLCSNRSIDATMLREAQATFEPLPARPPSAHPLRALRWAQSFLSASRRVRELLRAHDVAGAIALGGFVSVPGAHAVTRAGIPCMLLNLDAVPGRANRRVRRWCAPVLTALPMREPAPFRAEQVGMPVRRAAIAAASPADCRRAMGLDPEKNTLLITGASQGAKSINTLMLACARAFPSSFTDWQVLHLCGSGEENTVEQAWRALNVSAVVLPFLGAMGMAWGAADLAVSRAGASSVAEAHENAVPTIFLPYPWHRDQHQTHNARPLESLGGAIIVPDLIDPEATLRAHGDSIRALLDAPDRRSAMRRALETHSPEDAADRVVSRLLPLIER